MDVRQSVLVLTKGVVPDIAIAVVNSGEVLVTISGDTCSVVVVKLVVSIASVGMLVVIFGERPARKV